jgi:ABC-2 type transport system permease protein
VNIVALSEYSLKASAAPWAARFLNTNDMVVKPLLQNMSILLLFFVPAVTMRSFAEEKRSGCMELLLTYPIADSSVVLGKFLGSALIVLIMLLSTLPCMFILFGLGRPDIGPVAAGYLGLLFMGTAFTSIGVFVSSLTENQIVAFSVTLLLALGIWAMSWVEPFTSGTAANILTQFSLLKHMELFEKGIISLSDTSFFVLFIAFFLFLTFRSIETYRWKR